MSLMRKLPEKKYVRVFNTTAQAPEKKTPEKSITLQALGLITNLWSYPENWDLHKLELYQRFEKNKKTSVSSAWHELVEAKYILEYKVRINGKNDYEYFINIEPFTEEEIAYCNAQILEQYGDFSGVDFQDLKNRSRNSGAENQHIINTSLKKDFIKEINKDTKHIKDSQSVSPIEQIAAKVWKNLSTDRLTAIIECFEIFESELDYQDLKYVLHKIYDAESKKPIKNFKNYLRSCLQDRVNLIHEIQARAKSETKPIRQEDLPEYWEDKKKTMSDEEIEEKKREIEEILKDFKK